MAVSQGSIEAAQVVRGMKADMARMAEAAARHGAERLVAPEPHRVPAYAVETDVLTQLMRIYYLCGRMARVVVSPERPSS